MTRLMAMVVGLSPTVVGGCVGYFGPAGPGGASDVPCFNSTEWSDDIIDFAFRSDVLESDVLLFTARTREQGLTDVDDGSIDYVPHEAVYRFDPASGEFTVVDDSEWDTAEGEICDGCIPDQNEGPFRIGEDYTLRFNGRVVPVAGKRAVDIFDAEISNCTPYNQEAVKAVAVVSIDGNIGLLGDTTGQHYHELFSKIDGSPIGSNKRLALADGNVRGCWTADEKYVVYRTNVGSRSSGHICVVPVADELAGLKGQ